MNWQISFLQVFFFLRYQNFSSNRISNLLDVIANWRCAYNNPSNRTTFWFDKVVGMMRRLLGKVSKNFPFIKKFINWAYGAKVYVVTKFTCFDFYFDPVSFFSIVPSRFFLAMIATRIIAWFKRKYIWYWHLCTFFNFINLKQCSQQQIRKNYLNPFFF